MKKKTRTKGKPTVGFRWEAETDSLFQQTADDWNRDTPPGRRRPWSKGSIAAKVLDTLRPTLLDILADIDDRKRTNLRFLVRQIRGRKAA